MNNDNKEGASILFGLTVQQDILWAYHKPVSKIAYRLYVQTIYLLLKCDIAILAYFFMHFEVDQILIFFRGVFGAWETLQYILRTLYNWKQKYLGLQNK